MAKEGFNGIWSYKKKSQRLYHPYLIHKINTETFLPNIDTNYRIPMKILALIKRAYFAIQNDRISSIPPIVMHGLLHTLIKCGDLLHDSVNKISFFESSNKMIVIWKCECCNRSGRIPTQFIQRNEISNCLNYNVLFIALCDPRSVVYKHIHSARHENLLYYYQENELKYLEKFKHQDFSSF